LRLAHANASTTNVVVDSSSLIKTQLSAVHNNNDIGLYANSAKAVTESTPFWRTRIHLHLNTISKRMEIKHVLSWRIFFAV